MPGETTKLTIRVPEALHERLRKLAFESRKSINQIMTQAAKDYLEGFAAPTPQRGEVEMPEKITPAEAWEGYVGSQSPAEFMRISREKGFATVEDAVEDYVEDLPAMMDTPIADLDEIARLLTRYIEANTTEIPLGSIAADPSGRSELFARHTANGWEAIAKNPDGSTNAIEISAATLPKLRELVDLSYRSSVWDYQPAE